MARLVGVGGSLAVAVLLALPGLGSVGRADPLDVGTSTRALGMLDGWTALGDPCPDPSAVIESGPSGTTSSPQATLSFRSPDGDSYFECSLDGAAWGTCSSPKTYAGLGRGAHVFRLRASYGFDPGGHGPVAQRSWTVQAPRSGDYPRATFFQERLTDRSGQLPLLVDQRIAEALLGLIEAVPARAVGRDVIEAPIDLLGRCHLAGPALVAGLAARASQRAPVGLTRRTPTLGARLRRIGGRRHRGVPRAAPGDALELIDLRPQCRHLIDQPRDQPPRRLAALERHRLCILAPHTRKVPSTEKDSCSDQRPPVNGYWGGAGGLGY